MGAGNYSVEATIMEDGKPVKGMLALFIDEYAFGRIRGRINWEKAICEKGTVAVKGFLRSVNKPCITFVENGTRSPEFILDDSQMQIVQSAINEFASKIRGDREQKEAKAKALEEENRKREEEKQRQLDEEQRIREESKRKADEEYRQRKEAEQQKKAEEERVASEERQRKLSEKHDRIQRELENINNQPLQEEVVVSSLSKKAGSPFLDNPYRVLGISCLSTNEEANTALDKLKKLARLKALDSYKSQYDLTGIAKPARDLSVAQNALTLIKDKNNKWFWFASPEGCVAWQSGKYRIELAKDGMEYGNYDLFLANYLYAVVFDPDFNTSETWKRILNYYCYICKQGNCELLRSRFNDREIQDINNTELLNSFRSTIFQPILLLCERDDLDAILRLHKCIKDCGNRLLDGLSRNVLGKLVSWFTDKEADVMRFLNQYDEENGISESDNAEIRKRGDEYCSVVEPVFEMVLRDFRGDPVRYDMIKESYKSVTYQLMYVLHHCSDKSNAIYFANKCYAYCKADDKKRIQNTFGEVNIKAIDWNTPHTGWDIKGDEYYYGRGCAVDYSQALYWYHKAADAGNMYSQNSIGLCYQKGNGVPQSDEQAILWFEQACDNGNPEGAFNLAECYFEGKGIRKDIDQALKYWSKAAKMGHPSAQRRYDEVFSKVQVDRKKHRAKNHVCHDLGFQMTTGPRLVVEVSLNRPANVYLVNGQAYQNYLNGTEFSYKGGYTADSLYRINIPSSNHWYVIVDSGDESITGLVSSAKVKNA